MHCKGNNLISVIYIVNFITSILTFRTTFDWDYAKAAHLITIRNQVKFKKSNIGFCLKLYWRLWTDYCLQLVRGKEMTFINYFVKLKITIIFYFKFNWRNNSWVMRWEIFEIRYRSFFFNLFVLCSVSFWWLTSFSTF